MVPRYWPIPKVQVLEISIGKEKMVLEHLYRPSGSIKDNYEDYKCDTTIQPKSKGKIRADQIQHVLTAYKEERRERGG